MTQLLEIIHVGLRRVWLKIVGFIVGLIQALGILMGGIACAIFTPI